MIKTTILPLLAFIGLFLWSCEAEISLSPFRVRLPSFLNGIGWVLIVFGIAFLNVHYRRKGDKEGYIRGVTEYNKAVQTILKDKENK